MEKAKAVPLNVVGFTSSERISLFIARQWVLLYAILFGIYAWLPFFAPVFMHFGQTGTAKLIYLIYSFLCHQLPERSFFLFGAKGSYSLAEIQIAWKPGNNPLVLRQFIGNAAMGWKVAWSDRMVSMFSGLWLFGLIWSFVGRRLPKLNWKAALLFLLPMALDGSSHFISDLAGIGQGFRDSNAWLSTLTGHLLSPSFYAGDSLGSFNSWMRLLTGILFAIGVVWFGFPFVKEAAEDSKRYLEWKKQSGRIGDIQEGVSQDR